MNTLTVNCHEIWTTSSWDNVKTVATKKLARLCSKNQNDGATVERTEVTNQAFISAHVWWVLCQIPFLVNPHGRRFIYIKTPNEQKYRSVQLSWKYWHAEALSKQAHLVAQTSGPFAVLSWFHMPCYYEKVDLEAIRKHTEMIAQPIGPFAVNHFSPNRPYSIKYYYRGILWQKLPQLTMSVSPAGGFKRTHLICKTWFTRSGTRVAELGPAAGF